MRINRPRAAPKAFDIEKATVENDAYRTVAWTGKYLQVTLMSIPVGQSIGLEAHPETDQFLRLEAGKGQCVMGASQRELDFVQDVEDDWSIQVPAGVWHDVINTGEVAAKKKQVTGASTPTARPTTPPWFDHTGRVLGDHEFPATAAGYRALLAWLCSHGTVVKVGVEGTGTYGAGLARYLAAEKVALVEVDRPDRKTRRMRGKSDPIDAIAAARAALSGQADGAPKTRIGPVEAIRALRVAPPRRGQGVLTSPSYQGLGVASPMFLDGREARQLSTLFRKRDTMNIDREIATRST